MKSKKIVKVLKKKDKILNKLSIKEYSFKKISDIDNIVLSDQNKSIIHQKLYDKSVIDNIKNHIDMEKLLAKQSEIIMPKNFSKKPIIQDKEIIKEKKKSDFDKIAIEEKKILNQKKELKKPNKIIKKKEKNTIEKNEINTIEKEKKIIKKDKEIKQKTIKNELKFDGGYLDGFKQGEIKAYLKTQKDNDIQIKLINDISQKLLNLKNEILDTTKYNLYEITKMIAEAVLRKEIIFNIKDFYNILENALNQIDEKENIEILINPKLYNKLILKNKFDFKFKVISDENIAEGDFKINYKKGSINGNLRYMIEDLFEEISKNSIKSA